MNRRRAFDLLAKACGASLFTGPQALAAPENPGEHLEWVVKVLESMLTIKVGDTRKTLLRVFTTEGGLATGLQRTYVSQACPYFKVDVMFRAVGRPERDSGGVTLLESDRDIIIRLSRPYLAYTVAD